MEGPLKILHIEDDPLDVKLVSRTLTAEGLVCNIVVVETREDFAKAVEEGRFDVILADFSLPGFTGREALAVVRQRHPEVPFIFVTGAIGEEEAIDLLKQGATDYVLKDHLSRLTPAVHRALEEAGEFKRRRIADQDLKESNLRLTRVLESITGLLERLFENSHVLIAHLDSVFNILRVNQAYAQANKHDLDYFAGKNYFSLHANPETQVVFARVLATGEPYFAKAKAWEPLAPRARGDALWNWSVQPVKNERGQVEGLLVCLLDVTRQKQFQKERVASERKYRDLVENVDSIIMRWSPDGIITFANRFSRQFFGYPDQGLIGANVNDTIFSTMDVGPRIVGQIHAVGDKLGKHSTCEGECVRRDGSHVWIRWTCRTISETGRNGIETLCVGSDITDRKRKELDMERIQRDLRAFARTMGTSLHGRPVSPGLEEGVALLYHAPESLIARAHPISPADVDSELGRFDTAMTASVLELEKLREHFMSQLAEKETGIIDVHLAMLKDASFAEKCKRRVRDYLVKVEHAVADEVKDLEAVLLGLKQEVMRERSADVRDISRRVLSNLRGPSEPLPRPLVSLPPNTILVAERLLPSDTLELDRPNLAALVTELDGPSSHVAILARAMGIPAVCDVSKATLLLATGDHLLVDAETGTVTVAPTKTQMARFKARKAQYAALVTNREQAQTRDCVSRDGISLRLYANIGRPDEINLVTENRLEGVGLFRSEFLFLDVDDPPSLEAQREVYASVARVLNPHPVVIRTMDLGGDKIPLFAKNEKDLKLRMGRRGLAYSLAENNLFQTQIRAILQASQGGNIRIMFPMVMDVAEMKEARRQVEELASVEAPGKKLLIGAMIETPAAVFEIHEILEVADFVSIGTNDLTHYILARDRSGPELAGPSAFLHPSVLRATDQIVRAAKEHAVEVSVCGEAASDPITAFLLMGMGVRDLSMSPLLAARVRQALQLISVREAEQAVGEALAAATTQDVKNIVSTALGGLGFSPEH